MNKRRRWKAKARRRQAHFKGLLETEFYSSVIGPTGEFIEVYTIPLKYTKASLVYFRDQLKALTRRQRCRKV